MLFLTIKEYAKRVNLSEKLIRRLVMQGKIPSVLIGAKKRKLDVEEADKALKNINSFENPAPAPKLTFRERLEQLRRDCA